MTHLLVTNDFPPKLGGIQSYLWELWRRLPSDDFVVLTTPYSGDADFDSEQAFRVVRTKQRVLLPTPKLIAQINALAKEVGATRVVLDPALPLGLVGKHLELPYSLIIHGAEVTLPGRLPGSRHLLGQVLKGAESIVAAGGYPAAEAVRAAGRDLPIVNIPPGVDTEWFSPLDADARNDVRKRLRLPVKGRLIVSVSRLVPRKGMDVLIEAAARLAPTRPDLTVAIAGEGRDRRRLERLIEKTQAPVRLMGRVAFDDLPGLYGCADVFAMLCRDRWFGLEQEGFGIVFLEAAASGTPSVAGNSGGAYEAVEDARTGILVSDPNDLGSVTEALGRLLDDPECRLRYGQSAHKRAQNDFSYDLLAMRLKNYFDNLD